MWQILAFLGWFMLAEVMLGITELVIGVRFHHAVAGTISALFAFLVMRGLARRR